MRNHNITRRWILLRRVLIPVVVSTVVAVGAGAPVLAGVPARAPAGSPASNGTAASRTAATPEQKASAAAKSSGKPVTVDALTNEYSQVVANPNGTFSWTSAMEPVRARKNGVWVPVDTTLVKNHDGTLSPAATPSPIAFSGGGSGPMATLGVTGKQLSYTFPLPLPAPRLSGDSALYPEVLPGVDLRLQASARGGMSEVLIVKNAAAAANPALATLHLGVRTSGLALSADAAGNLDAKDASGGTVFHAPTPAMWDSSDATRTGDVSTASSPGVGAKRAVLGVKLTPGGIGLTPDRSLLTGAHVKFPVYIDPDSGPTGGLNDFDEIQQCSPNTSNWDSTTYGNPGVGYMGFAGGLCGYGIERSFYQIALPSQWKNKNLTILPGTGLLHTWVAYAAANGNNTNQVQAAAAGAISPSTTWNSDKCQRFNMGDAWQCDSNSPSYVVNTFTTNSNTPNFEEDFNITNMLQTAGQKLLNTLTIGLFSTNESSTNSIDFVRFATTGHTYFSATYDYPPNVPLNLRTSPNLPLNGDVGSSCGNNGYLGRVSGNQLTLQADVSTNTPSTNVRGVFSATQTPPGQTPLPSGAASPYVANGSTASYTITLSDADNGHTFNWWAATSDGTLTSPAATSCHFTYDKDAPGPFTVTSTDFPSVTSSTAATIKANNAGSFTFGATDAISGVRCFEYILDGWLPTNTTPCTASGNMQVALGTKTAGTSTDTVTITPTTWGTHTLTVDAVDQAGNRTQPTYYSFYVLDNPNTVVNGNITTSGNPDLVATDNTGALRVYDGLTTNNPASTSILAANPDDAPDGHSWKNTLVTHRGTFSGGLTDDLAAWSPADPANLYYYENTNTANSSGSTLLFPAANRFPLDRPTSTSTGTACVSPGTPGPYACDWHNILDMVSLGNVAGGTGKPTMLTIETDGQGGANLWAFKYIGAQHFANAVSSNTTTGISGWNWANMDLAVPGDLNGDTLPDLWIRDRSTGKIYQMLNTTAAGAISFSVPTGIGGGSAFYAANYPQITSIGDINGSGHPALLATTLYGNTLVDYPGTGSTGSTTGLSPAITVTAPSWNAAAVNIQDSIAQPTIGALQLNSLATPKCLDDLNGNTTNTTSIVDIFTCNASFAQVWNINSDGTIRPSFSPTKCLDIISPNGPATASGAAIDLYDCNGGAQQQWQLRADTSIINPYSGKCLRDPNASTTNTTQFIIDNCAADNANGIVTDTGEQWTTPANTPAASPINMWRMDEGTGPSATDEIGANSLTLTNTAWTTGGGGHTTATTDSALTLDGSAYATGTAATIDPTKSFTVSAWVNANSTNFGAVLAQNGNTQAEIALYADNGSTHNWNFEMGKADTGSSFDSVTSNVPVSTTAGWVHLVATFDASTSTMSLYVNGQLKTTGTHTTRIAGGGGFELGRMKTNNTEGSNLNGTIDQVRIYNTALTPSQVTALYSIEGGSNQ